MRFRFLILSCVLLFTIGLEAVPYTLQQCIDTALVNNLSVRQQANRLASQRLAYKQSKANISPELYGNIGQSWGFGRSNGADNISRIQNSSHTSFNLSANLMLFDGLAMKFNIDEAAANMQASEADLQAQQLQIKMNVTTMFLQVLLCRQLTETAATQLADTQAKWQRDSALVAAQRLAAGELYTLQAQVAKEQLALVQQQNELRLALLDLAQAIDIQDMASFDIAVSDADTLLLLPLSAQEVYDAALTYRPEITALEYTIAAQEAALKSAKAAYSPTLSAGASVGSGYYNMQGSDNLPFAEQMNENFTASVGLNLSVPLYDRMQTTTRMRQQRLAVDNAKLQLAQQKQTLRKEIDQAYYNALSAQLEEQSAMEAERSAAEALRYAEQKQEAGRASAYEYREAKNTYAQALATRLQARYNLLFRIRILHYYQGTL